MKRYFLHLIMITILLNFNIYSELSIKIAPKEDLNRFLQDAKAGPKSKLVFHNNGFIYYIDFSEDPVQIHEILAAKGGILPVISPDGEYFVFSKGALNDGVTNPSGAAYLCQLKSDAIPVLVDTPAFVPRFVQNAPNPTVVYSTCGYQNDSKKPVFNGCGVVVKRSFISGTFGTRDTVWREGSYYGGLSWDEKYLATAWLSSGNAIMLDITKDKNKPDTIHLHLTNTLSDKDTLIPNGACNPSISSSRIFTNAMMYFDMRYTIPPGYSNSSIKYPSWDLHQLIFITHSDGKVARVFESYIPTEFTSEWFDTLTQANAKGQSYSSIWDNPEWSNHPYLATAISCPERAWALPDSNGKLQWKCKNDNEHISLINVKKASYLTLLSSTDTTFNTKINFEWPWFWAQIPDGFTEEADWLTTSVRNPLRKQIHGGKINIIGQKIISDKLMNSISFYDLKGALVWRSFNAGYKIDFPSSKIARGTYFIKINLANQNSVLDKITIFSK